jgi:hypothetical protein
MLVVSKERYLPVTINTLVLSKGDRYFYIHRDVYDQAVILSDKYPKVESLINEINGSQVNQDTVAWFYENAPKPIHSLAPFLLLVDGEIEQDMEICCGVLHAITAMINVRNFILKPIEIRKSVSFSLSIKEEYEMAWERFFMTAIPYEQRHGLIQPVQQAIGLPIVHLDNGAADKKETDSMVVIQPSRSERNAIKKLLE